MGKLNFSDRGVALQEKKGKKYKSISRTEAFARGAAQGVTLGFAEELTSSIGAGVARTLKPELFEGETYGKTRERALEAERAKLQQAREERPGAYYGGVVGGGVLTGVGLAKAAPAVFGAGAQQGGLVSRGLQAAKVGAAEGAISGVGTAEGGPASRAIGGAQGAALGAALGPVAGEATRAIARGAGAITGKLKPSPEQVGRTEAEKVFARDVFSREDLLEKAPEARQAMEEAAERGVTITPGEAFDDPALLGQQAILQQKPGLGSVRAAELAEARQTQQLPQALEEEIAAISTVPSPDEAGRGLIEAAKAAERKVRQDLSDLAKPFYDKAYKANIKKDAPILNNQRVKDYLRMVRRDFPEYENLPNNNLQVLDEVKKLMDGDIASATSGAAQDRNTARLIGKVKTQLIDALDKASPDYAEARKIYAEGAPEIEQVVKGRLGRLAQVKAAMEPEAPKELMKASVEQIRDITERVPRETLEAGAAGVIQAARDAVRGEAFDTIQKRIFNTPKQREQFSALLGDKYESFVQLMDIFKKVGKGQRSLMGSPTQPRMEAQKKFSENVADIANDAVENKANFARRIMRGITGKNAEIRNAEDAAFYNDMANVLLTPRGVEIVEDLAKLKPSIEQTRRLLKNLQVGTVGGVSAAGGQLVREGEMEQKPVTGQDFSTQGKILQ